ncbi:LLM class flavin-dependent oxidoreductase [Saccharopolyspora sp. NPDC047091]|uniref:LLM class flavin-dependent oxidoreductase n=1 Tax=Saccharopolyspora sp. NPDC047091 TaxID=3155924 RepID=UPI0033CC8955
MSAHPEHPLHLAVALDGAGWHPAAWRDPQATPQALFTPGYWTALVRAAERGLFDFATIEDALGLQSDDHLSTTDRRTDRVRGRLDAELIAAFVAPLTSRIGLVPTVTTTHTEPFHLASALATLDHDSLGRAGWRVQTSVRSDEAAHFGRRALPEIRRELLGTPEVDAAVADLFEEAADAVEVVRRLWDSWEDDTEIRDAATGRFLDRDKLHHVDFSGRFFSVRGPGIVPRPPQGQPLVVVLAHGRTAYELAARSADVVLVTPQQASDVPRIVAEVRAAERAVGRTGAPLRVLAELVVAVDADAAAARDRVRPLDELAGAPLRSDAAIVTGSPAELADVLQEWRAASPELDGFRLRPAALPTDLDALADGLVPELQRRGAFRTEYDTVSLRERFGLARPASRYANTAEVAR